MYQIKLAQETERDLIQIYSRIYKDSPRHASLVIDSIFRTLELLSWMPKAGPISKGSERQIISPSYRYTIRYSIHNKEIIILAVFKYKNNQ